MSPEVLDEASRNYYDSQHDRGRIGDLLEFDEDSSYNSSRDINVTNLKSLKHFNNNESSANNLPFNQANLSTSNNMQKVNNMGDPYQSFGSGGSSNKFKKKMTHSNFEAIPS